ncbi:MAG: glycosyltransferase family 8 protein [Clostridia bacterium]
MNILMAVNKSYLDKAMSMLLSLRLTNKDSNITLYLINANLDIKDIEKLRTFLMKKCDIKLELIQFDKGLIKGMPIVKQFSVEVYYRIFAHDLLPKNLERILWLDADIIIMKNIVDFYYQNFDDKAMVASKSINCFEKSISNIKKELNIDENHIYFNSGVLLLNLKFLRDNITSKIISNTCYLLKDKLVYPDQDILNYLYQGKIKYADDKKYNNQILLAPKTSKINCKNIYILHYAGPCKPWNYRFINKYSKFYWSIQLKRGRYLQYIFTYIIASVIYSLRKIKHYLK